MVLMEDMVAMYISGQLVDYQAYTTLEGHIFSEIMESQAL
jgi:hypothetical protein